MRGGHNSGTFYENIYGADITGRPLGVAIFASCSGEYLPLAPITISLKPDVPLEFATHHEGPPGITPCVYNLAITVEQLTQ